MGALRAGAVLTTDSGSESAMSAGIGCGTRRLCWRCAQKPRGPVWLGEGAVPRRLQPCVVSSGGDRPHALSAGGCSSSRPRPGSRLRSRIREWGGESGAVRFLPLHTGMTSRLLCTGALFAAREGPAHVHDWTLFCLTPRTSTSCWLWAAVASSSSVPRPSLLAPWRLLLPSRREPSAFSPTSCRLHPVCVTGHVHTQGERPSNSDPLGRLGAGLEGRCRE